MATDEIDAIDLAIEKAEEELLGKEDINDEEEPEEVDSEDDDSAEEQEESPAEDDAEDSPDAQEEPGEEDRPKSSKAAKAKTDSSDALESGDVQGADEQSGTPVDQIPFWSSREKSVLAKVPQELRGELASIIAQKEAQRNEWVNKVTAKAEKGLTYAKRTDEVFAPYSERLKASGAKDVFEVFGRMLEWDRQFSTDPVLAIQELVKRNQITAEEIFGGANSQYDSQAEYADPRVEQALEEAREAKRLAEEYRQNVSRQQDAAITQEVENFRKGTDSLGRPRAEFAKLFAPQISKVYSEIVERSNGISVTDALDQAYEYVLSQSRAALGGNSAPQSFKTKQAPKATAPASSQKAKAAAGSVKSSPGGGTTTKKGPKDIDEAIRMAESELGLR